jgi:acyl-homoserine-lactone acylase
MNARAVLIGVVVALLGTAANSSDASPQAEIRWTRFGVPHIKAADYEGLGFGYGYAIAPHRLCLLADRILTLRGERSRWFGPDAPVVAGFVPTNNLNADLFHRVQLSAEEVATATESMSADARAIAAGYAAGFSRYVAELSERQRSGACQDAPIPTMEQSDVVRAVMSIGVLWKSFQVLPFAAASIWGQPAPSKQANASVMERPPTTIGSNAWAYGADATRTGSAIVVGNPHTFWRDNWLNMHQLHLTIPGKIDVAGADFAGLPLPVVGFNDDVAWSMEAPATVTYYVMQKMQVETGAQPAYVIDGQRRALRIEPIALDIKQPDGSLKRQEFPIAWSELGALYQLPEMPGRPQGWYAVTDAGAGNALGLDQLLAMARAKSTIEFRDAVVRYRGIGSHLIAGDRKGDVLYVEAGPLLDIDAATLAKCAVKGAMPTVFDGSRSECAIRGREGKPRLVSNDQQPAVVTRGIVQNVNNSYHYSIHGQTLSGYSPLLGQPGQHDLRLPMSEQRMRQISNDGKVTEDDALAVVFDNRNYAAETWLDDILKTCKAADPGQKIERACAVLAKWDRKNDATSRGALLFHLLWPRIQKIPDLVSLAAPERPLVARSLQLTDQSRPQVIAAIEQTVAELEALKLAGDEPWGSILAARTPSGRVPLHGGSNDAGVLNVLEGASLSHDGYAAIVSGSAYIQLVRWEGGRVIADVVLAHGQSADPASAHATDQLENFANKRLVRMPFTEAEIKADPAYRTLHIQHAR